MDDVTVVIYGMVIGFPLLLVAVVTFILLAARARPQAGLGAVHDGVTPPSGRWNVQILADSVFGRMGGSLGALAGHLEVREGHLSFIPRHAPEGAPAWTLPCRQIAARANGALAPAGVVLRSPHGELRCDVSEEHINAHTRNSFKTLREPRYYREFVDVLVANGATRF